MYPSKRAISSNFTKLIQNPNPKVFPIRVAAGNGISGGSGLESDAHFSFIKCRVYI